MSFLNFLWSSSTPAPATVPVAASAPVDTPTHRASESLIDDSFVLIDTPMASSIGGSPILTRTTSVDSSASPPAETVARSCRLYGHAHKPPRIIPSATESPSPVAVLSPPSGSKRSFSSFADALKSTPNPINIPSSSRLTLSYAQDASLTIADQLLAQIEYLESKTIDAPATIPTTAEANVDDVESVLASIDSFSPPFRPTVALTRDQARLYDESTSWTLSVNEPSSKRTKRQATGGVVLSKAEMQLKRANKKGKSKATARMETKEMGRARGAKCQTEL